MGRFVDHEECLRLYRSGTSIVKLAQKYGVQVNTILAHISDNFVICPHNEWLSTEKRNGIREEYEKGTSIREICKNFQCSYSTIKSVCADLKRGATIKVNVKKRVYKPGDVETIMHNGMKMDVTVKKVLKERRSIVIEDNTEFSFGEFEVLRDAARSKK